MFQRNASLTLIVAINQSITWHILFLLLYVCDSNGMDVLLFLPTFHLILYICRRGALVTPLVTGVAAQVSTHRAASQLSRIHAVSLSILFAYGMDGVNDTGSHVLVGTAVCTGSCRDAGCGRYIGVGAHASGRYCSVDTIDSFLLASARLYHSASRDLVGFYENLLDDKSQLTRTKPHALYPF